MNAGGKKPPINLVELRAKLGEEPEVPKHQPGELTYVKNGNTVGLEESASTPTKSKIGWDKLAIAAGVGFLLSVIFIFSYAPAKGDLITLNDNIKEVNTKVENTITAFSKLGDGIDTAVSEARSAKTSVQALEAEIAKLKMEVERLR